MPWTTSDRKSRLPRDWVNIRRKILTRDRRKCRLKLEGCLTIGTEVDHVVAGDDHSMENLQAVCAACHARKSSSEGNLAQARRKSLRYRPKESHPGLRKPRR